jgi:hypothetical protein
VLLGAPVEPVTPGCIGDIVVGPTKGSPGRPPSIRLVSSYREADRDGTRVDLTSGDWVLTDLCSGRYLVFHDGARRRFGVLDLRQEWFAEVPFRGPVD